MSKELLINKTFSEMRIALLENGEMNDYFVTREILNDPNRPIVGNIYAGKVTRVLPGMQSSFIDIGYEKAAFLYVDDAYIPTREEQRTMAERYKNTENDRQKKDEPGEIIDDDFSTLRERIDMPWRSDIHIEDVLKEGETILVQVSKEPISTKGPRVTRHITLAGCYLVFMPFINHIGISRRIKDEKERQRLKEILDQERNGDVGLIARSIAEGIDRKTLQTDYEMLTQVWEYVQKKKKRAKPRQLIRKEISFVERALRDIGDESIDSISVDDEETLNVAKNFIKKYRPRMKSKINLFNEYLPIFEHFGIDIEIERALSNKIYLKSGGSINIDQTEALVSIDVNTGKFIGKRTFEETILKTNLEAVKEIVYQIRIRNCGGIIIIDFIDMVNEENRQKVHQALLEALKKDRAKTNVLPISELGLVEMTRKRTRDTLSRMMCKPCPYCEGTGKVKSVTTVCYEIVREVVKKVKKNSKKKVFLYAHPEVSARLCSDDIDIIDMLEKQYSKTIIIRAENNYHFEQYELHCE